jgi:hypothetical protein
MERQDSRGAIANKNVNWIDYRFWVTYTISLLLVRWALYVLPVVPHQYAWTFIHVGSSIIFFYLFHWVKGTPFWQEDDGEYDSLTFWEQIDDGVQYTANRKFLTIMPIIVFLLASYDSHWEQRILALNIPFLLVSLIGKTGYMHGKRIAGINKD